MLSAISHKSTRFWLILSAGIFSALPAYAGEVMLPHVFTSGTPAVAAQVNSNFYAIKTAVDDNHERINKLEAGTLGRIPATRDPIGTVAIEALSARYPLHGFRFGFSVALGSDGFTVGKAEKKVATIQLALIDGGVALMQAIDSGRYVDVTISDSRDPKYPWVIVLTNVALTGLHFELPSSDRSVMLAEIDLDYANFTLEMVRNGNSAGYDFATARITASCPWEAPAFLSDPSAASNTDQIPMSSYAFSTSVPPGSRPVFGPVSIKGPVVGTSVCALGGMLGGVIYPDIVLNTVLTGSIQQLTLTDATLSGFEFSTTDSGEWSETVDIVSMNRTIELISTSK